MKINKINVYYSTTIQMRQFEPVVISTSAEVQIDPADDPKKVFKVVYKQLHDEVEEEARKKKTQRKESYLEEEGLEKTA